MNNRKKKLFIVIGMSMLTLCCCSKKENDSKLSETEATTTTTIIENNISATEVVTSSQSMESNTTETTNASLAKDIPITVNYKSEDGSANEVNYSSLSSIDLNRPSSLKGNEVFIDWKESVTDQISNITEDSNTISLTPEYIDISDTENAIYNDTIFTSSSDSYITVPVIIGGQTNFSVIDLEILFDTNLFSFDSFEYEDEDAVCNYTKDGKILVSFVSTSNISADINLCNIKLKKNNNSTSKTKITYTVKDIAAWNEDCSDYINVTYEIINDQIVMY